MPRSKMQRIAFAVPGEITALTGGTIYDARVMAALRDLGCDVQHVPLPGGFPYPSTAEASAAMDALSQVPADVPLVVDGLAFGALPPEGVHQLQAPLVPLVHHPLALESGRAVDRDDVLYTTEKENLRAARAVIVPSPHTGGVLVRDYAVPRDMLTVARPGTDRVEAFASPSDLPMILSVGIQLPRKGHDVLVRALALVQDLPWEAVIVGSPLDPNFAGELIRLRDTAGLAGRVTLAGRVSQEVLSGLYQRSTVFALATRYEGYGIVFDEAVAHGLPIVTCRAGAVPDTVPRGAGVLTPPDTPEAFAEALRQVLTDDTLRDGMTAAAQRAAQSLATWHDTARTFLSALQETT